jgi:hypothetical protein
MDMQSEGEKYYSMAFIEEEGKTFVLFYDSYDNLVDKREIPRQDVTEAIRLNNEK